MRSTPTLRIPGLPVLALLLILPLAACGDDGPGNGSGSGPTAAVDGAESPQALIDRMMAAAKTDDFAGFIPCLLPEQRPLMTLMLGVMPVAFMTGMAEAMLPMAGAGGPEKAAEAKKKLDAMKTEWNALLAKHKVDASDEALGGMQSMQDDPAAAIADLNAKLGHVDHATFIREAHELLAKHSDKKDEKEGGLKEFTKPLVNLQVDGDKATVEVEGDDRKLALAKQDGRWYVDLVASMKK